MKGDDSFDMRYLSSTYTRNWLNMVHRRCKKRMFESTTTLERSASLDLIDILPLTISGAWRLSGRSGPLHE